MMKIKLFKKGEKEMLLFVLGFIMAAAGVGLMVRAVYYSNQKRQDPLEGGLAELGASPDLLGKSRLIGGTILLLAGLTLMFPAAIGAAIRMLLFTIGLALCGFAAAYYTIPAAKISVLTRFSEAEAGSATKVLAIAGFFLIAIAKFVL